MLVEESGEQPLRTQATGYLLRVRPESMDACRFSALLERGRRELASGEAERASTTLRNGLALWRGAPLADLGFEPFAQSEIARLEELRLTALDARVEADLALGRQASIVGELETLVAAHPYREGLRAQLMLALYRDGRQAEALETYRHARRTFSKELGIEPGPRLQELEGAILRHDTSLRAPDLQTPRVKEESNEIVRQQRRFPRRWVFGLGAMLVLAVVAAVVAAARHSSGGSLESVVLAGDSVAVIDPRTDTIVGEIPVGDRLAGPAVGEGSVWVGNRDDHTLLRIDPTSLDVVRTIGLGRAPIDVDVGAVGVWVLSDQVLLRLDPATNHVVDTIPLPPAVGAGRWNRLEVGANAVFVCSCASPGNIVRINPVTRSVVTIRRGPIWAFAYGRGALWAITGWEQNTIQRIDPHTNAVENIPLGRLGERSGWRYRMSPTERAIWVLAPASLWRLDATSKRFLGSVPIPYSEGASIAAGDGAVWIATSEGVVLRIDPDSQKMTKTIPLGTLIYPAENGDPLTVGEGFVWVAVASFAS